MWGCGAVGAVGAVVYRLPADACVGVLWGYQAPTDEILIIGTAALWSMLSEDEAAVQSVERALLRHSLMCEGR